MPGNLLTYFVTTTIFLAIDLTWLSLTSNPIYKKYIGHLMSEKANLPVALVFYLVFTIGLIIFSINPALQKDSIKAAVIFGALYGFFTYATYDVTNFATLKDWPFLVVAIDILWGTFICAMVSILSFLIIKRIS